MTTDTFAPLPPAASASPEPTQEHEADTTPPMQPARDPLPELIQHRRLGVPSKVWRYPNASGELLFAVARFDQPNGEKQVLPYTCGPEGWGFKAPPAPRPLYGLDAHAAHPEASIIIVEGEKAADAAAALFPDRVAMTWQGGSNAVNKADWTQLRDRRVVIWPDNDAPGQKAAAAVARAAKQAGATSVAIVDVPTEWPAGWDVADALPEGVTTDTLLAMLAAAEAVVPPADVPTASDRDVELQRLALLDDVGFALARRDAAKALGISLSDLMAAVKATRRDIRRAEREAARERVTEGQPAWTESGLPPDPYGREDLFVQRSDLPIVAQEGLRRLTTRERIMYRGGLVRLVYDAQRNGLVVETLSVHAVVSELHAIARPYIQRAQSDGTLTPEPITLPERVAHLMLAMASDAGFKPLDGIASAPLLAEDGSLRVADGYDPLTRMWCEHMPAVEVPSAPTRHDAEVSLRRLRRVIRTFAFADAKRVLLPGQTVPVVDIDQPPGVDESAALVALLTAVCRPSLRLAPGVLIHAPAFSGAGTGKGLLVRVICAIAFGMHPRAMTAGGTLEELDKRLVAALIGAEQTLFLDNVNGMALRSDALASAITERPAYVRVLGSSTTRALNPVTFVVITGNGVVLSEDLARRFITIELDAGMEDPEARDFKGDLLRDVMEHRGVLLRDALTIWRWGRLAGDEIKPGRPLGSFGDWSRWCRDPLLALGCADPAARVADTKANDPRRKHLAEVFSTWWERHHDQPIRIVDLHEDVRAVADPTGKGRQYLAAMIGKLEGTRAAGFLLARIRTAGKWSPDLYALQRTAPEAAGAPCTPMSPMPMPTGPAWESVL
jgi:putative DNA primase/helicase